MITTQIATQDDLLQVLDLQDQYLYANMTEIERQQGFVTTPFTLAQLEEILLQNGLFIAKDENQNLIAYAFAGSWKYFEQWEIFNFMVSRFPQLSFHGKHITTLNSFQYGPVCIEKSFRGKEVLNLIFEEMRLEFLKKYPISLTFINKINSISTAAHTRKLGWEIIDEFNFNEKSYITLAFDMQKSVVKK